jgi:hypothetical protein
MKPETETRITQLMADVVTQLMADVLTLQSDRHALMAQNAELVKALRDQLNDCINFDGGKLTDVIMEHSSKILKSTPAQCLRDIQARAGRAGFIACSTWLSNEDDGRHTAAEAADEYAAKVQEGSE